MLKQFFAACLSAAVLISASTMARAVDLTLWAPASFTPSAGLPAVADVYRDVYARFQAENPDIKIKFEVMAGNTEALRQILAAATANKLPDVAVLDGFWIARLAQTGKLQQLNELWTAEARGKFHKEAIDAVTIDGKVYAAWFYNAWRGLYYRKDVLAKLGYSTPPATWDEFLAFAEKAKTSKMSAVMYPGSATELTALHMLSMFWGYGGELVDDAGKPIFFEGKNRSALEQVYAQYRQLVEKGYMPADVATMDEAGIRPFFYTGENATTAQSSSAVTQMYSDAPALRGNLGAFNYPLAAGAQAKAILVGWTYGIFAEDPQRKAAAWKFVDFMLRPENLGKINAASGHLPIVPSIWNQDFYKSDPLMIQFKEIFDKGGMRPRPTVPIYPAITAAWAQQMADVLSGKITPARAVDNAQIEVMNEYRRISTR